MNSSGSKRKIDEVYDPRCSCAVCFKVLLDPVTLPCGHTADQACLQRLVAEGNALCPSCREPMPAVLPNVNVEFRSGVQRQYPQQVSDTIAAKP
jgi:hypothetical protein